MKTEFLCLPYVNQKSEKTARKIKSLVIEYFEKVKMIILFKSPSKLDNHFLFNDKITNKNTEFLVVYKVNCYKETIHIRKS